MTSRSTMPAFRRSPAKGESPWKDPELAARVARQIRNQLSFTRGYSPLYSALLNCCLEWLLAPEESVARLGSEQRENLVKVGAQIIDYASDHSRSSLEASLSFAAALHSFVLAEEPRAVALRPYYATAGGDKDCVEPGFESALLEVFAALSEELFGRAKEWGVQTNESSRGLAWLLPAAALGVEAAHLVELGASAGLNLYAEQRSFVLLDAQGQARIKLGAAQQRQFEIATTLEPQVEWPDASSWPAPKLCSRAGADLAPVDLNQEGAELGLAACIWGDQPQRLERLREGIKLHRLAQSGKLTPKVQLDGARLPEDLESFLGRALPGYPQAPVIAYNTYVTEYFNDVDERALTRRVRAYARKWSIQHKLPWMWIRFEPPRQGEAPAPQRGWCRWEVELFEGAEHCSLQLGWAHPHFRAMRLGRGFSELVARGGA